MPDCIFCKIVSGTVPSAKVYENDAVVAFLDINPVNSGHTLVVPKEHFENLTATPDAVVEELLAASKKVAAAILKATGVESTS